MNRVSVVNIIDYVSKLIIMGISILLLCGCVNNEISIDIGERVVFNNRIMFNENAYNTFIDTINNESDEYISKGYNVKKEIDGDMKGFVISRDFGLLDKVSSSKKSDVNLGLYGDYDDIKLFKRSNFILFSKYTSNFYIDYSDKRSIDNIMGILSNDENIMDEEYYEDMENLLNNGVDSKFILNTKYIIGKSNSNSKDNSEYVWNIDYNGKNEIYFDMYVMNVDLLLIIGIFIIIVIICSVINFNRNKRMRDIANVSLEESLRLEKRSSLSMPTKKSIDERDINALNNRGRN